MIPEEEEAGFLTRWSRRKRAVEAAPEAVPLDAPPDAEAPPAASEPQACPIPGLAEIDLSLLPKIEDLTAGSDFSLFLRPGIPAALRSAALRRMWSLDPAIRDFIGPADYAWDYNNPAGLPPGFSLEIGEGVKKLLAQVIGEPDADAPRKPDGGAPVAMEPEADLPQVTAEAPVEAPEAAEPDQEALAPRRRHGGAMPA
ncbi:DUF3306 domain-containing protein [Falsiroseomonas sp. E2-1-a20]|uniref:DUF3306 domain-containing protein n=1 Tax=Falsiroseomonas sp. E2-1-a20 TaxID=3239300 RepID=UPI003F3C945B